MRLVQFRKEEGGRGVGLVEGDSLRVLNKVATVLHLAQTAIAEERSLTDLVADLVGDEELDYTELLAEKLVLPPVDHPDPAHLLVTGTGLSHLGSASARDEMHQKVSAGEDELTDSMKMFKWGVEGGKPEAGQVGVQPEWFYKGDGRTVIPPEGDFPVPSFAEDGGEEPEIVGLYLVSPEGKPLRLGYALGNEFSDHVMERRNYLYLAHSKLRACSFGPELLIGELPADLRGMSRIYRGGKLIWEKPFLSGEANMSHTIANLVHHHFKYPLFRQPGDLHAHFFGTATLSYTDEIAPQEGDTFEIEMAEFGKPLRNGWARQKNEGIMEVRQL